jgi:hypothetical protein
MLVKGKGKVEVEETKILKKLTPKEAVSPYEYNSLLVFVFICVSGYSLMALELIL